MIYNDTVPFFFKRVPLGLEGNATVRGGSSEALHNGVKQAQVRFLANAFRITCQFKRLKETDYANRVEYIKHIGLHLDPETFGAFRDVSSDLIIIPGRLMGKTVRLIAQRFKIRSFTAWITDEFFSLVHVRPSLP